MLKEAAGGGHNGEEAQATIEFSAKERQAGRLLCFFFFLCSATKMARARISPLSAGCAQTVRLRTRRNCGGDADLICKQK